MIWDAISLDSLEGAAPFLGACALRAALIMAVAALLRAALRRRSAAVRHAVVAAALAGVFLLPVVTAFVPPVPVAVLPAEHVPQPADTALIGAAGTRSGFQRLVEPARVNVDAPMQGAGTNTVARPEDLATVPANEQSTTFALSCTAAAVLLWAAGAIFSLLPTLAGLAAIMRKARRASLLLDADWQRLLDETRQQLGVRRRVRLLQSSDREIPTTWGILRSVILLPADAIGWPEERRRIVLLHELAHVKRHDYVTQLIAYVVRALHWFDPFAWLSVRALRIESERACDDLIVTAGSPPSNYAQHLLDMVRTLRPVSSTAFVAIAMARQSRLESRIRAVLDGQLRRGAMTRGMVAATVIAAMAITGILGVLHPVARVLASEGDGIASVTLPSGGKVELVAVRRIRSDDKTFWRPDGTPLNESIHDMDTWHGMSGQGGEIYEFSFAVTDCFPKCTDVMPVRLPGATLSEASSANVEGFRARVPGWRGASDLHVYSVCVPQGSDVTTIAVEVPSGKWEKVFSTFGGSSGGTCGSMGTGDRFIAYLQAQQEGSRVWMTVTDSLVSQYPRLVAIDKSGQEHPSSEFSSVGSPDFRMGRYGFDGLSLDDIKEFQFEVSLVDTIEFSNVSLVKGETKTVEVSMTPSAARAGLGLPPPPPPPAAASPEAGAETPSASRANAVQQRPASEANLLRQIGLAFKRFSLDSPGMVFPRKSAERGVFLPEKSQISPKYVPDDAELMAYLEGQRGVDLCYFGHVVRTEGEALALLDAYDQEGVEDFRDVDITVTVPRETMRDMDRGGYEYEIRRLREGVERSFVTNINDPAASIKAQSETPVLWEMPDSPEREGRGGQVLYMDGHVEWVDYPGAFPMTEAFVTRLRQSLDIPKEERQVRPADVSLGVAKPGAAGRGSRFGRSAPATPAPSDVAPGAIRVPQQVPASPPLGTPGTLPSSAPPVESRTATPSVPVASVPEDPKPLPSSTAVTDSSNPALLEAYAKDIASVEHEGLDFARTHGKQALIDRYRRILEQYPGFPKSVYLESQIGQIWEWDLIEQNEPQNLAKAVEVYESILQRYKPDQPYMKEVMLLAADRCMDLNPEKAKQLYENAVASYPADDRLRLESYVAFGRLAEREGNNSAAEEYFARVMAYDPSALPPEEFSAVQVVRSNAAVGLFWLALDGPAPAASQLTAVREMIARYPQIELWRQDLVVSEVQRLEKQAKADEVRGL